MVAIVAGVGLTLSFSVGLLGAVRYTELRRQQRPMLSALCAAVAIAGFATAAGSVVYGLVVVA